MQQLGIERAGGSDQGLSQRDAAVVCREGGGRNGIKAEAVKPLADAFEQNLVLEHAAGKNCGHAAMRLSKGMGRSAHGLDETAMKARCNYGAISSGCEVLLNASPKRRPA